VTGGDDTVNQRSDRRGAIEVNDAVDLGTLTFTATDHVTVDQDFYRLSHQVVPAARGDLVLDLADFSKTFKS
jgi:hypothetical protein